MSLFEKISNLSYYNQWLPIPDNYLYLELNDRNDDFIPNACIARNKFTELISANFNGFISYWQRTGDLPKDENSLAYKYSERLVRALTEINNKKKFSIKDPVIVLSPVYSGWNFGHELSILLWTLLCFRKSLLKPNECSSELKFAISSTTFKKSPNTLALLNLFIPTSELLILEPDTVYDFSNLIIPPSCEFHLYGLENENNLKSITQFITKTVCSNPIMHTKWNTLIDRHHGKFVLCKSISHKSFRPSGILPPEISDMLTKNNWYIINPEILGIFDIIYLLQNSTHIVLGTGAIQYAHKLFIPKNTFLYQLFLSPHNYQRDIKNYQVNLDIPESSWSDLKHWNEFKTRIEMI